MIFATVGTHQDGFPRMLEALGRLGTDEELVVQYGHGTPPPNATRSADFLPFGDMAELFDGARVVVTHAGVGSILLAVRAGHTPVIIPRRKQHGEHVDDHQVELARALEERGGVLVCWEAEDLPELIARVPPRGSRAGAVDRPLAVAVRAALHGEPPPAGLEGRVIGASSAPAGESARPIDRIVTLAHHTAGAYFMVGTGFQAQELGTRVDPDGIAGYHCDFRHKTAPAEHAPGTWLAEALDGRPVDSPMSVSQAALGFYERHLDGEAAAEPRFRALADWLVRYGVEDSAGGVRWGHDYAMDKYGLQPGWISGMTQGEAISVLLRAHVLTGEPHYLATARAAFAPFRVDVADGGVVRELDGALVVEEYPTLPDATAVLNGWIFGLLGLYELAVVTGDAEVRAVFDRSRDGLIALLPRYDVGWWSRYSLADHGGADLAKPFYQHLHGVLLTALDRVSPDPVLRATAARWADQVTKPAMARIAVDKVVFRARRALKR